MHSCMHDASTHARSKIVAVGPITVNASGAAANTSARVGAATWDLQQATLELIFNTSVRAFEPYIVAFTLHNQAAMQPARAVFVEVSLCVVRAHRCHPRMQGCW